MNFKDLEVIQSVSKKDMNGQELAQMEGLEKDKNSNRSKAWANAGGATVAGIVSLALATNPLGWAALAVGGVLGLKAYSAARKFDAGMEQEASLKNRVLDRRMAEAAARPAVTPSIASTTYGP